MPMPAFPAVTEADWRAACERFLKGKPFETLVRETEDGIARGPLFSRDDRPEGVAPLPRADMPLLEGRPWHVLAPVRDPDLAVANVHLLDDLRGGASAVRICAGEGEVPITRRADLRRLLEGVYTDLVPISFSPNGRSVELAEYALAMDELGSASVRPGLDPLEHERPDMPEGWKPFTLSPRRVHERGGTPAQELADLAATLAETLRRHGPEAARDTIVELSGDQDMHAAIAKLRAARRVIATVLDAFGAEARTLEIHSIGSRRMMQAADPWTNLLRVMGAGVGAVVGGADAVMTRPFTDGFGRATPFAHRIARNMQLLMMEESHLGLVRDAAHGSYWHETVTDRLAQEAWALFQKIERAGGIAEREWEIAEREPGPVVGVTLHPVPDDVPMPEVLA